ncbi:MAG: PilN domain-containing protein [Pseudomonadota bacterium]
MPRINLLPWREEQRKERQKQFGLAIVGAVLAGGLFIWVANFGYQMRIDGQNERNARLQAEIDEISRAITEIEGLERQKERLLARMEIIEQLQRSRPEVVHLFDEMVKATPEGVFLTSLRQQGRNLQISGTAQSSTRVSALMRNIDSSEWLTNPQLDKIETVEANGVEEFRFELRAQQINTDEDGGDV